MNRLLLCTDLDRTLIPNGEPPESPGARALFARFVLQKEVQLVYVSGRHKALIQQAIADFQLPDPDFAIADVGATIYHIEGDTWLKMEVWEEEIAADWQGLTFKTLHPLLSDITSLELQEAEKQSSYKLSYYLSLELKHTSIISEIQARLKAGNIAANIIWSIDELRHVGLLDILPASANKLHAITFLMQQENYGRHEVVFAGDSGNDLDVLLSPLQAVLVANADDQVRAAVQASANTYLARGDFLHMNGNYSAGILEGVSHFRPQYLPLLRSLL